MPKLAPQTLQHRQTSRNSARQVTRLPLGDMASPPSGRSEARRSNLQLQGPLLAPIQRLRILRSAADDSSGEGDDDAMSTGSDTVSDDMTVGQAIGLLRDNLEAFDYRYQDYINNDGFIGPIVQFIEASFMGHELSREEFFEQVKAGLDVEVPKFLGGLLADSDEVPQLSIELPDLQVRSRLPIPEVERQLGAQVGAINEMSVADWLRNILLNRLKSVDTVISKFHGSKGGLALAEWLNHQLLTNDKLARFAMQAVIRNIETLSLASGDYADSPLMAQLLDTALVAQAMDDKVFATFESLGGVEILSKLNQAGLQGGLGRQHGTGDEKWFRDQFGTGVESLQREDPKTFERNAILHNPDQCAGGDMAICSVEKLEELIEARDRFLDSRRRLERIQSGIADRRERLSRLRRNLENHAALLANWNPFFGPKPTRQQLAAQIATSEAELARLEAEHPKAVQALEEAAEDYRNAMRPHLGNYDVNSFLGRQWMKPQDELERQGRVEHLIRRVLALLNETDIETLEQTRMDIRTGIDSVDPVGGSRDEDAEDLSDEEDLTVDTTGLGGDAPTKSVFSTKRPRSGGKGTPGLSKRKKEVLAMRSVDRAGKQQTLDALAAKKRGTSGSLGGLAALRRQFRIGHASGRGMNCLIRAVLRAAGQADTAQVVMDIRRRAWALGLVGEEEMFDLDTGGAAAVLQQIQAIIGGFMLTVLQVNPQDGAILAIDQINVGGGGANLYILHMGAHFSPLFPDGDVGGWLAGLGVPLVQRIL